MLQTSVLFSTGWDRKYITYLYIYIYFKNHYNILTHLFSHLYKTVVILCMFARSVVTNCHKLNAEMTEICCLSVLDSRSQKARCARGLVPSECCQARICSRSTWLIGSWHQPWSVAASTLPPLINTPQSHLGAHPYSSMTSANYICVNPISKYKTKIGEESI